jgi:murein DD-endopeptidase MepM/ murein hydrolase activator NlpD
LEHYQTRTALIVPFQGPGLVDQAWMADLGHTNVTEQFAVDLLALSEGFGRSTARPEKNEEYAGWGRPILAPAAGVIATVQDGIPNQPKVGEIDERSFTLADGRTVGYGNHVVIDHENGEYSLLVHLQAGSIPVKAGTRVRQGQQVGRLGSSGFSTEPHLHYQLQDRPDDEPVSLPFRFSNLGGPLRRGVYFASA